MDKTTHNIAHNFKIIGGSETMTSYQTQINTVYEDNSNNITHQAQIKYLHQSSRNKQNINKNEFSRLDQGVQYLVYNT